MSGIPAGEDILDPDEPVYDLPTVAEKLGLGITKVHQVLRDGHLLAVRRKGIIVVPQRFFTDSGAVVKTLGGLLAVLRDGGYKDNEILQWLFTADPSLTVTVDGSKEAIENARPIDALHAHQAREIVRRAQAMSF